jgi:protoheme IX farnesyltransferase
MDQLVRKSEIPLFKRYVQLTKPGIVMGNALTAAAGFVLASSGACATFLGMLAGISLIMASGCVANNYLDRQADQKMARTRGRALVVGSISLRSAQVFAAGLCLIGAWLLAILTNPLTLALALLGWGVYVGVYTPLKKRSSMATLVGSIAGAIPPVVGYCAVTGHLGGQALLLFGVLVAWQMPHFYAIALYRLADYRAAGIPVLPLVRGVRATQVEMLLYTMAFLTLACALEKSPLYLTGVISLGLGWMLLCLKGFRAEDPTRWARKMFFFSLLVIVGWCTLLFTRFLGV